MHLAEEEKELGSFVYQGVEKLRVTDRRLITESAGCVETVPLRTVTSVRRRFKRHILPMVAGAFYFVASAMLFKDDVHWFAVLISMGIAAAVFWEGWKGATYLSIRYEGKERKYKVEGFNLALCEFADALAAAATTDLSN